jgi:hypothetical protein
MVAYIAKLVELTRRDVEKPEPTARIAILDWAELPWDEHRASCFLHNLRDDIVEARCWRLPVVHINVPRGLLVSSKEAVRRYSSDPLLPTCVFLDEGSGWRWLGLSVPDERCRLPRFVSSDIRLGPSGDPETRDEQFLRLVFDSVLEGRDSGSVPRFGLDAEAWGLAQRYLRRTTVFREKEERDRDGEVKPSGRFEPVVGLDGLRSAVAATFVHKLRTALASPSCDFLSKSPRSGTGRSRGRKGLVKLPNGLLVDSYYRCDGLLDYSPQPSPLAEPADPVTAQIRFRDELSAHLVDLARELEHHSPGRFDVVVSCTSPTHWFVHQIADGLSDARHRCGHFVGRRATTLRHEFRLYRVKKGAKALVFTDVLSTGSLAKLMISTLQSRGLTVGGLIALVDTRTPEELAAWRNRSDPTDLLDSSNQVVLVHAPVMKRQRGKARWRIDPETPEPQEVTAEQEWTGTLSGAGAVALPGRVVARWLVDFAALRHKHYTHGGHHSEFVCDLKRLFHRPCSFGKRA